MLKTIIALLFIGILQAQTAVPDVSDPLDRTTPQSSVVHFLEACHARDYTKAVHYLDLRKLTPEQRAKQATDLARQLEDLLDDTPFSITSLSRQPEGDNSDGLSDDFDTLDVVHVDGKTLELRLERVLLRPGLRVWLVSAASIAMIPTAHQLVAETPFEKTLPQFLVTFELFDTPVWRWIALVLMAAVLWYAAKFLAWGLTRPFPKAHGFRYPLRLCLALAGFRFALAAAPPSVLAELYVQRAQGLLFSLSLAWAASALIDLAATRWHSNLDPRVSSMSYSVLPLGRQILKLSLFLFAVLTVLSAWGYNTSTILAGLGVGGLAIALAAQKTIENLFGGVSVIGDRPVLVGDVCRFGDRTGTIMHIGLRSTRIRTPERTIISVPNAQFAGTSLENVSARDKIWFHHTFNLRRDTTSAQLAQVIASVGQTLAGHKGIEVGKIPVRFTGVSASSFDIEVAAYVLTHEQDDFLATQQELLIQILQAIEGAGTALSVPLQETFEKDV